jgi:hypothetical protein
MINLDMRFITLLQLYHVSLGLVYLHANNVVHGDLKAVGLFHFVSRLSFDQISS